MTFSSNTHGQVLAAPLTIQCFVAFPFSFLLQHIANV